MNAWKLYMGRRDSGFGWESMTQNATMDKFMCEDWILGLGNFGIKMGYVPTHVGDWELDSIKLAEYHFDGAGKFWVKFQKRFRHGDLDLGIKSEPKSWSMISPEFSKTQRCGVHGIWCP